MSNRNLRVIDINTGEDLTNRYTTTNRNQAEGYKQKLEKERYKLMNVGKRWVASYDDPIKAILKDMSLTEAGAMIKLLPYLRFKGEGQLINNAKPLKQSDIQRILGRGRDATRDILKRLESFGIVFKKKSGRSNAFYISSVFHTYGPVREGETFTKLFREKTQAIVKDLDLRETGFLYKVQPFFHKNEYYLCDNADEEQPELICHLTREELAERIGHDPDIVTELVNKLQKKGAILSTKTRGTVRYLVHPDVMFRKQHEDDWTQAVRKMFEQHKKK